MLPRDEGRGLPAFPGAPIVSRCFGQPLQAGFDTHVAGVAEPSLQAVPRDRIQYVEVVTEQQAQLLPLAVVWMK